MRWFNRTQPETKCVLPLGDADCGEPLNGGAILVSEDGQTRTPLCHFHMEALFRAIMLQVAASEKEAG